MQNYEDGSVPKSYKVSVEVGTIIPWTSTDIVSLFTDCSFLCDALLSPQNYVLPKNGLVMLFWAVLRRTKLRASSHQKLLDGACSHS